MKENEEHILWYTYSCPSVANIHDPLYNEATHLTLQETGDLFGVTRERIRQMEAKGLEQYDMWKTAKNKANLTNAWQDIWKVYTGKCKGKDTALRPANNLLLQEGFNK